MYPWIYPWISISTANLVLAPVARSKRCGYIVGLNVSRAMLRYGVKFDEWIEGTD